MMRRKSPTSENIYYRKSLSRSNISKGRRGKDFITSFINKMTFVTYIHVPKDLTVLKPRRKLCLFYSSRFSTLGKETTNNSPNLQTNH